MENIKNLILAILHWVASFLRALGRLVEDFASSFRRAPVKTLIAFVLMLPVLLLSVAMTLGVVDHLLWAVTHPSDFYEGSVFFPIVRFCLVAFATLIPLGLPASKLFWLRILLALPAFVVGLVLFASIEGEASNS